MGQDFYVHPSSYIDQPCRIGSGTKIWHFCHVMTQVQIGNDCVLGQNVMIASNVKIGNNVKIQNNVSVFTGVVLEDDVFCGPSCVFTNIINPRSQIDRKLEFQGTLIRRGTTIGANATIVCGIKVGQYAFIGAGAVVHDDVPDYGLMLGTPAEQKGWMSRHGQRLTKHDEKGIYICSESKWRYQQNEKGLFHCLDWPEEQPLVNN